MHVASRRLVPKWSVISNRFDLYNVDNGAGVKCLIFDLYLLFNVMCPIESYKMVSVVKQFFMNEWHKAV